MRTFCRGACAALCVALAWFFSIGCAGPYEPPFVWKDGFVRYAHVGWFEGSEEGENELTVLRSVKEQESFCARFPASAFGQAYAELPSLEESVADLDEAYFAENVLLIAYFPNESGSCRLRVEDLSAGEGDTLVLTVRRTVPGGIATEDIVGRAVLAGLSRDFYGGRKVLLAVL